MQMTANDNAAKGTRRIYKRPNQPKNEQTYNKLHGWSDYIKKLTLRDTNMTETYKVGLQPWTAVSTWLGLVSTV